MTDHQLPDRVRHFILTYISSVLQLEIILQLHAAGARFLTLNELSTALGLDTASLQEQLADLLRRGLVASQNTPEPVFAYASAYTDQDQAVIELAEAYRNYRVSVINLIYSRPTEKIRTFAEAFRFLPENKGPFKWVTSPPTV
jgi:hypothetical protein